MKVKTAWRLFRVLSGLAVFVLMIALWIEMSNYDNAFVVMQICFSMSLILLAVGMGIKMHYFRCPNCKEDLKDPGVQYCPHCGEKIDAPIRTGGMK